MGMGIYVWQLSSRWPWLSKVFIPFRRCDHCDYLQPGNHDDRCPHRNEIDPPTHVVDS